MGLEWGLLVFGEETTIGREKKKCEREVLMANSTVMMCHWKKEENNKKKKEKKEKKE